MRHHISAVAISLVMTLISSSVLAETKIAFVDVQRAILSSEQAKKLRRKSERSLKMKKLRSVRFHLMLLH